MTDTLKNMKKLTLKYYWHIHHGLLIETLTEPLKNRIKDIKENKPKNEIPLRLRLLKPVIGKLPSGFVVASQACDDTRRAYDVPRRAYDVTLRAYLNALKYHMPAIKKLHAKECGCGYDFKRNTIFTKKNGWEK